MSNNWEPVRIAAPPREGAAGERKRKLGMGLDALLRESRREEPVTHGSGQTDATDTDARTGKLRSIPIDRIAALPDQPRTHFDEEALNQLAASIAARGVIQPVIVRPQPDGRYQLVAGERRWRAARIAGLSEVPAIVRTLDAHEVKALALIENLQREDLNPLEEARAYQRLADDDGMTQAEIARLVDKSRSHVANMQRLLSLPQNIQTLVEQGSLSSGHARALVGVPNAEALARTAVERGLSVREVEELVRREGAGRPAAPRSAPQQAQPNTDLATIEAHLQEFLGMPIRIKGDPDGRKGALTVQYRTLDQLDLICQRLTGGDI